MRILFISLLTLVFLSACAAAPSPMPTTAAPPPAASPLPTATPPTVPPTKAVLPSPHGPQPKPTSEPTLSPITVVDIKQAKQPDGSVKTTAQVTAPDNLGLGQMEVASPETMVMGETRTIRLRISPAEQIASTTPVPAPGKTPDLPKFVYKFGGNIQLYALMIAELRTLSFDVDKTGPIRREIKPNIPITWDWIVSPRSPGRQELAIEISIPAVINGIDSELTTLQDVPLAIIVQSPVPTPVPLADRISESLLNNSGAIIVALIGLLGTLIGILVKMRSDQEKTEKKSRK